MSIVISLCNIIKSNNDIINHIISYMIDLIQLEQFNIITYLEINIFLIIYYIIYLIKSTFTTNLLNEPILN